MTDFNDSNDEYTPIDVVNNAISADPETIEVFVSLHFLYPMRERILSKKEKCCTKVFHDSLGPLPNIP